MMSVLDYVYMLYYVYSFIYVKPTMHPWNETNLHMVYNIFNFLSSPSIIPPHLPSKSS
jgi:hypothetical protein